MTGTLDQEQSPKTVDLTFWRWFMLNKEIPRSMQLAGFRKVRRSVRTTRPMLRRLSQSSVFPPEEGNVNSLVHPLTFFAPKGAIW